MPVQLVQEPPPNESGHSHASCSPPRPVQANSENNWRTGYFVLSCSTNLFSKPFSVARELRDWWCGRWELNPHGPCDPADFLTGYGFRRSRLRAFGAPTDLRSGLSLHLT